MPQRTACRKQCSPPVKTWSTTYDWAAAMVSLSEPNSFDELDGFVELDAVLLLLRALALALAAALVPLPLVRLGGAVEDEIEGAGPVSTRRFVLAESWRANSGRTAPESATHVAPRTIDGSSLPLVSSTPSCPEPPNPNAYSRPLLTELPSGEMSASVWLRPPAPAYVLMY